MSTILNAHQYEYANMIQLLSVFFGTLIAAPLIVSKKAKKRLYGLMAVITGSFCNHSSTVSRTILFCFCKFFWLLNALNGIKKIRKEQRKKLMSFEIIKS